MSVQIDECRYCHVEPVFHTRRDGFTFYSMSDSEITLAKGNNAELAIGADKDGRVIMRAWGDGYTDDWYPNFCPVCGRKINMEVG